MSGLRRNRWLMAAGLVLVGFVAVALVLPPPGTPDGPYGTSILRRLLETRGVPVSSGHRPAGTDGTFFLAHDLRTAEQARQVLDWVRSGGRAVVADPSSAVLAGSGIHPHTATVGGLLPEQDLTSDCALAPAAGVSRIVATSTDATFRSTVDVVGCFLRQGGTFLAERRYGRGTIVGLGGLTPLTNAALDQQDDVVLAWNLLGGSGRPVVFGSPLPPGVGPPPGLWSLLPAGARFIIIQAIAAAVLFAVVRGRRLGKPVEEAIPSPIPATGLVTASAELYRRARAAAHASSLLRDRFRSRAGRRLGLDRGAEDQELVRAVAEETGMSEGEVGQALHGGGGEGELVATARALERLERRMEGDEGWGTETHGRR